MVVPRTIGFGNSWINMRVNHVIKAILLNSCSSSLNVPLLILLVGFHMNGNFSIRFQLRRF